MGFSGKAGSEIETQAGVVLEPECEGGGIGAGIELDIFYDLASGFKKVDEFSISDSAIVAVCGTRVMLARFFTWVDGAISFDSSHHLPDLESGGCWLGPCRC